MNIIVLLNSEDLKCREFVDSIPKDDGNTYCFIDWYKQPEEIKSRTCPCHFGQPYEGPSPSAFPELVIFDGTPPDIITKDTSGQDVTQKIAAGWVRVRAAESVTDVQKRDKFEARVEKGSKPPKEQAATILPDVPGKE